MKFGRIGISPPVERSELPNTAAQVKEIHDALQVIGRIEQFEAKSKLLKDALLLKSEEYLALAERHKNQNEETLKRL